MTERTFFVIRNQLDQYLDKHNGWHSGKDSNALYKTEHRDEALNTLIEINAKDISLRGSIIEVPSDDKKRPVVEISETALKLDKVNNNTGQPEETSDNPVDNRNQDDEPDTDETDSEPETILIEEK